MTNTIITQTGCYIPDTIIPNDYFLDHAFYDSTGKPVEKPTREIIAKLEEITGIKERRFASEAICTSDMATFAAKEALEGTDPESLDYIIVGHNFGDIAHGSHQINILPTVASRVKHKLGIKNPYTVAFDLPFGCPGWLQAVIMADYFIKSGDAKRILVIGAEVLSRVTDPHDMDIMIYADGAGATLLEATEQEAGIISHLTRTDTFKEAYLLAYGQSYGPELRDGTLYLKMQGHDIYRYAVKRVPQHIRSNLEKAGIGITEIKKILLHQANEKMDEAMLKRLFKLCGQEEIPADIAPMMISWTGNSSVATLPTLFDLICKGKLDTHRLASGDLVVFASVGAGMNINSMIYRMP
jgi:3-oxoacyl-[acyl-carrier-protein] synthase-3